MVTSSGGVKIADFGLAKVMQEGAGNPLTVSGTTMGTPAYMAPEQALATDVGPPADLYAVGVLAYEMFSGNVPFHGSDVPMAIMLQHLNDPVPPLGTKRPDLDPGVCAWVERMLAKAPEDRPRSAAEACDELDELVMGVAGPRWRRAEPADRGPPRGSHAVGDGRGNGAAAAAGRACTKTPWSSGARHSRGLGGRARHRWRRRRDRADPRSRGQRRGDRRRRAPRRHRRRRRSSTRPRPRREHCCAASPSPPGAR